MTRNQKRNLANLVLSKGLDVLLEFWTEDDLYVDLPSYQEAKPVLQAWHAHIIAIADKCEALAGS